MSEDYKKSADSNAFYKKVEYPARGSIYDRNGQLLVFNQPSYDIVVVEREAQNTTDTAELCATLGITKEDFVQRMEKIKATLGYSRYTEQPFLNQLNDEEYGRFLEKNFHFPGFYVQRRSLRQYQYPYAAHVLGDIAEVSLADIEEDKYYRAGDYIGKTGIEKSYEQQLRGKKGIQIKLRDIHGRIRGSYHNGELDEQPVAGQNLTLSIDIKLQELAEKLLEGKIGSIVAIEPSTGEVLCMASSPTYDPRIMTGKQRSKNHIELASNPTKPLLNRAIMGLYPPGSTFKTSQALTFLTEEIININTAYPCNHGFNFRGLHVGCHGHGSPLAVIDALATSCNGFFCWGLYYMIGNNKKYGSPQNAMNRWRDYMVSMGFGYKLGIDLPGEKRGMIPNANFYDDVYNASWNGLTVISIAIGQGEVTLTPLQIANLCATIANRGYYYTPHLVKEVGEERITDTTYTHKHYTLASHQAYDNVVEGMRRAVMYGTCRAAETPDYKICGKTGTAQNRGQDHSVFMGFAPMEDPKIAVAVYVENGGFGASYGVPIGALIIEKYINGELSETSQIKADEFQAKHIEYGTRVR